MSDLFPIDLSILTNCPIPDEPSVDSLLLEERTSFNKTIIVLDDDPTGIQTVHGVPVYTDWTEETIKSAILSQEPLFFLLTNSRSFSKEETVHVHTQIAETIGRLSLELNRDFLIISRGDSTLRGHYPLETDTLNTAFSKVTGTPFDGEIICPFFLEGGRYTIDNIHYVKEGRQLIPAGLTEFAKDKSFGYASSHLGDYVEEKSQGVYKKKDCIYISLEELRGLQYELITEKLVSARNFQKIIVNAMDYIDVKIFCICWFRAMKLGKTYLARSAAALPRVAGNIRPIPLLTRKDLIPEQDKNGGIIIIGSHVQKTSLQLEALKKSSTNLVFIEFDVNTCFQEDHMKAEILRIQEKVESSILAGKTAAVYTSRKLLVPDTANKDKILQVSVHISESLTSIVRNLSVKPNYIIAKGGITSSDVGTKGLQVKKALVMGQIRKGIPVWMTGEESKFPGIPYIIFPGNVGEESTLKEIVEELEQKGAKDL